jgi:hypothetical protein
VPATALCAIFPSFPHHPRVRRCAAAALRFTDPNATTRSSWLVDSGISARIHTHTLQTNRYTEEGRTKGTARGHREWSTTLVRCATYACLR